MEQLSGGPWNVIAAIAIWGMVTGIVTALALLFLAGREARTKAEQEMMRFGIGGTLFMIVWFAMSNRGAAAHVEIAIGIVAFAPLVASVVLRVARRP
jgi:hypothetical protein